MEIEDFVADYPLVHETPDFQGMFSSKLEFAELRGSKDEPLPDSIGEYYFRHQLMFMRAFAHYDDCWTLDEAGTGKTCKLGALAEFAKDYLPHIKRCIVICGKDQLQEFKQQLVTKCTKGIYYTKTVQKSIAEGKGSSAITNALSGFYKFYTPGEFARMINTTYPTGISWSAREGKWEGNASYLKKSNDKLIEEMSGTIFLGDEFHFIRIEDTIHKVEAAADIRIPSRRILEYAAIWRVFHLVVRSKRLIFTATPITNIATELTYHLNVLYPLDKQLRTSLMEEIVEICGMSNLVQWQEPPDWITRRDEKVMLQDYCLHFANNIRDKFMFVAANQFMAKISYVPLLQPTIDLNSDIARDIVNARAYVTRLRQANNGLYSDLERVRFIPMVGIQQNAYLNYIRAQIAVVNGDIDIGDIESEVNSPAHFYARVICGGVFPDGTYASEKGDINRSAIDKWTVFDPISKRRTINHNVRHEGRDLGEWFMNDLYQLSCKADYIVKRAYYLPGKRYVASVYVEASGAEYLGLALENFAYIDPASGQYVPSMTFVKYVGENAFKMEGSSMDNVDNLNMDIPMRYRYAIIHGRMNKDEKLAIYNLYNHPKNANGEYLKIIIISRVGQTGISLQETMAVDFYDVPWNPGTEYQTRNRAIRALSHEIHDRNLRLVTPNATVEVEVNMLIPQLVDPQGYPLMYNGRELNTIDLKIYLRTVDRGRRNAIPLRAMKITSIDCRLQKERNSLDPSLNGTPEANYSTAVYPCLGYKVGGYNFVDCGSDGTSCLPTVIDTSTYDVYFIGSIINKLKPIITSYFKLTNILSTQAVMSRNPWIGKSKYVTATFESMIKNGDIVTDSFGYTCYVRESAGIYFVTRNDKRSDPFSDLSTMYYGSHIVAIGKRRFSDIVVEKASGEAYNIVRVLEESENPGANLEALLKSSSVIEKIGIVEMITTQFKTSIYQYIIKAPTNDRLPNALMKIYYNTSIFAYNEPTRYIEEINILRRNGKIKDATSEKYSAMLNMSTDNPLLIHILYSEEKGQSKFGETRKHREIGYKIRIFLFKEGRWRDPDENESIAYKQHLLMIIKGKEEYYRNKFPRYYGLYIISGPSFKIIDLEHESVNASYSGVSKARAEVFHTFKLTELLYFSWQLGITYPSIIYGIPTSEKRLWVTKLLSPTLFTHNGWTILEGQTNSVPNDFVDYCYAFHIQNVEGRDRGFDKQLIGIQILKVFIKTGRIYSPSLDPNDCLELMVADYNNKKTVVKAPVERSATSSRRGRPKKNLNSSFYG